MTKERREALRHAPRGIAKGRFMPYEDIDSLLDAADEADRLREEMDKLLEAQALRNLGPMVVKWAEEDLNRESAIMTALCKRVRKAGKQ